MRLLTLILLLPLAACASRGPAIQQMEADSLFDYATQKLAAEEWNDAAEALERFTLVHTNHPRIAEARYRLGEAYMGREEYVTAAMEFNRLASDFPTGPWADDARYQVCRSYQELAPRSPLDQEYTRTAIGHCESLVSYYPQSEFAAPALAIVGELVNRLAEKDYNTAYSYERRRGAYDSAIIYYQQVVENYARTEWAPRALARMHAIYERLQYTQEAEAAKQMLIRDYPQSPEARQLSGVTVSTGL
jgi:outer membrane protein assembly factor BamD